MTAELGQIALISALLASISLGLFPMLGARYQNQQLMALGTPGAIIQMILVAFAYVMLTWAFVQHDFSVEYVALHSNSALPLMYRFTAVWSAHEGSLLMWALILSLWILAVAMFSKTLPRDFRARVLGVMGWIGAGFLLFIIFTSNPFGRLLPAVSEGRDMNPLLQDPGMIIHPPMLYMGYVGFAVAFAFAVAALLGGQVTREWVRWMRPWTLVAWAFLTFGIALGSWWAYYELGWGGWWFWDPVENASFMPWLVGTALIHSQAVTEKTGAVQELDVVAGHLRVLAEPFGHLPGALRGHYLSACLCRRSNPWHMDSCRPRDRGGWLLGAVRRQGTKNGPGQWFRHGLA